MEYIYEVRPCEKGHYRIFGKEAVYVDLLIGNKKAMLFDTGYGYGNLKAKVRELTDLPVTFCRRILMKMFISVAAQAI